ncbi:solute carrier family 13 member 5a isoform X2 [Xyrauchen texanus]|uniref:solute carrier family 13 member 5a isoform X2 n=1 Tax=Xyrauchen texanus TaxID=154827 RepID=UPI0022419748|nr:solute carrier family 13 member 5a isoform X2 [Xyrauchen texanus]
MVSHLLKFIWRMKDGLILFCTPFLLLPLPLVIGTKEAACAYVVALMAVYWCTEIMPLAVTALLPAVLFPLFRIMESKDVCMQYLKDTNMLFLGGLMVAVAVEHWNLHKRIALRVLLIVGVRPALLMLGFMGVTAFLSMWISNTATTAMMVPIVQAVLEQLNNTADQDQTPPPESEEKNTEKKTDTQVVLNGHSFSLESDTEKHNREEEERLKICKGLTLCVCYAASIGGTATLTGTGPNLVLMGQMNQLFPDNPDVINFASWFGFAFPNMIIMLIMAWLWLQVVFLGFKYVTDATVAVFIAALLFVFPSKPPRMCCWGVQSFDTVDSGPTPALLTWKVTQKKMPWSIILLLGGGFALAKGSEVSGLSKWLGDQMSPLQSIPPWAIAIILCLMIATFTECTSNVATATLFLPILASMSQSIGINPLYVMIPCTLSASFAFMLPVATPPNAIVFSYGYLKVSDMAKTGIVMNIIGILSITLSINSWGKAIFSLDTFPSWANKTDL